VDTCDALRQQPGCRLAGGRLVVAVVVAAAVVVVCAK